MITSEVTIQSCILIEGPISPELLRSLSTHENSGLRLRVAEHSQTPAYLLIELADDRCPEVRAAVAEHPRTPLAILEILMEDDHPDVRFAIAENANMPPHVLKTLAKDDNPYIAHRAAKTLDRLGHPDTYRVIRRDAA